MTNKFTVSVSDTQYNKAPFRQCAIIRKADIICEKKLFIVLKLYGM